MKKPKILIVEDSQAYQDTYARHLGERVEIIAAYSTAQAHQFFAENSDIVLIVMDGCVDSPDYMDTGALVKEIRKTFKGPMIAASRSSYIRQKLTDLGCDHKCEKNDVPRQVWGLIVRLQLDVATG